MSAHQPLVDHSVHTVARSEENRRVACTDRKAGKVRDRTDSGSHRADENDLSEGGGLHAANPQKADFDKNDAPSHGPPSVGQTGFS